MTNKDPVYIGAGVSSKLFDKLKTIADKRKVFISALIVEALIATFPEVSKAATDGDRVRATLSQSEVNLKNFFQRKLLDVN
jgi:hypothetical protein